MATFQYGGPSSVRLNVAQAAFRLSISRREVRALFDAGVLEGYLGLSESGLTTVPHISPYSVQDYQDREEEARKRAKEQHND